MSRPRLIERRRGGLLWFAVDGPGWHVAFSTRLGGVSEGPYTSLNLGLLAGDDPARVILNRERLLETLGLRLDDLVAPGQVHSAQVQTVDGGARGRGARSAAALLAATDALATAAPGVPLLVSVADCMPVLLAGESAGGRPALALVHAGWRGMAAGVLSAAAAALGKLGRLTTAVVGPSIGPCCFSVSDDVGALLEARYPGVWHDGRADLWACAAQELTAVGLTATEIVAARLCTSCDRRFFSHRRDQGRTGRQAAVAWIESPAPHAECPDGKVDG